MEENMKKAVELLGNACNNFNYEEQVQAFMKALTSEHRTLQQNIWRMIFTAIPEYANAPYDDRNKASVNMCIVLKEHLTHTRLPTT